MSETKGTEQDFTRFMESLPMRRRASFKAIHVLAIADLPYLCLDFNFSSSDLINLVDEAQQRFESLAEDDGLPGAGSNAWRKFWEAPLAGTGLALFPNATGRALVLVRGERSGREDLKEGMSFGA